MRTSQRGVDLIKSFEGLSLTALRLQGEQYYTVGYGHYGADVQPGQVMTQAQAEDLLRQDLRRFEYWVSDYTERFARFTPNQNQFDALVSFCYNCGPGVVGQPGKGGLYQLIAGRDAAEVAEHMIYYVKGASPAFTQGLRNRRLRERALFLEPVEEEEMERWKEVAEIPSAYLRSEAQRLVDAGCLAGAGEKGLDLTEDMLRAVLIAERAAEAALEKAVVPEAPVLALAKKIHELESEREKLERENRELRDEIAVLHSDVKSAREGE